MGVTDEVAGSVDEESRRLKALLRDTLAPGRAPTRPETEWTEHADQDHADDHADHDHVDDDPGDDEREGEGDRSHDGDPDDDPADEGEHPHRTTSPQHAADTCPVCRASRLAHTLAPELIDEVGRGMEALGRALRGVAAAARRHTDEHLQARTDEERA